MSVKTQGELSIRLAATTTDVVAAQRLRYRVFYEEMRASADAMAQSTRLDADRHDAICDHLLVVRHGPDAPVEATQVEDGELVGTYRLLRQDIAEQNFGFYTQAEFDIAKLISRKKELRFLELGRSCVLAPYRSRPVVELLWQGIWDYVRAHRLDVMLGCASFEGVDPVVHAEALSVLAHSAAPAPEWHVAAQPTRFVNMQRVAIGDVNVKRVLGALPPLIKGYLRLGCSIGEGAVIDPQFNTTDVLIILPVSKINPRYFTHFGKPVK